MPDEEIQTETIEILPVYLGTRPYILIEVEGIDENDYPQIGIRFGGGVPEEDVKPFLAEVASGLPDVARPLSHES